MHDLYGGIGLDRRRFALHALQRQQGASQPGIPACIRRDTCRVNPAVRAALDPGAGRTTTFSGSRLIRNELTNPPTPTGTSNRPARRGVAFSRSTGPDRSAENGLVRHRRQRAMPMFVVETSRQSNLRHRGRRCCKLLPEVQACISLHANSRLSFCTVVRVWLFGRAQDLLRGAPCRPGV